MPFKIRLRDVFVLAGFVLIVLFAGDAVASIVSSKHNLSVSGPGQLKALSESRICVFCHTPHNAAPQTPLWNREVGTINYRLYESSTLRSVPRQPNGSSRLCLSCHDGLIALGALLTGTVETTGEITPGQNAYIGTDLADDHPVSVSYIDSMASNPEIVSPPPMDARLIFYGDYYVECSTCHDAHDDTHCDKGFDCDFLVMSNKFSSLCRLCHNMTGWQDSVESTSVAIWNGVPPDPWPHTDWLTVAENACENCHRPHTAGGPQWLLNYAEEEWNCLPCHNGNVAQQNVMVDFENVSHHPVENTTGVHDPNEPALTSDHVECVDCHDPHSYNSRTADAPYVPGSLENVKGVNKDGGSVSPANYEYEICFRCHADTNSGISFIARVIDETNTRVEFSLGNQSFHPVEYIGKNMEVPSIPSPYMPTLTPSDLIYCTDCHESNRSSSVGGTGPRGPHGSIYAPILRERYETLDNTSESYANYALCYRCHNRDSILNDDSFKKNMAGRGGHSGHLAAGATCSVCHDPHGVVSMAGTGDHTHLINFDTRIVSPSSGNSEPLFEDTGTFEGNCTLVCHGVDHNNIANDRKYFYPY